MNYVYLLHFETKHKHAQHYLGATSNLDNRLKAHFNGSGSKLVRHIKRKGVKMVISRVWMFLFPLDAFKFEQIMKRRKNNPRYCSVCNKVHTFEELFNSTNHQPD